MRRKVFDNLKAYKGKLFEVVDPKLSKWTSFIFHMMDLGAEVIIERMGFFESAKI